MKKILWILLVFVFGIFLWIHRGYNFTQDLSTEAVTDVLDNAYSGLQVRYSWSVAQDMLQDFNEQLKASIQDKKEELTLQIKASLNSYLKQKIDELF